MAWSGTLARVLGLIAVVAGASVTAATAASTAPIDHYVNSALDRLAVDVIGTPPSGLAPGAAMEWSIPLGPCGVLIRPEVYAADPDSPGPDPGTMAAGLCLGLDAMHGATHVITGVRLTTMSQVAPADRVRLLQGQRPTLHLDGQRSQSFEIMIGSDQIAERGAWSQDANLSLAYSTAF